MSAPYAYPILAGILSAAILIAVAVSGLGFFFLFLPTLPLLWAGLGKSPRLTLAAGGVAALLIATVADLSTSIVYLMLLGFPSWYIARCGTLSKNNEWFPIGTIFTSLTLYGCALVALMAAYYATQETGLEQMTGDYIRTAFLKAGPEYAGTVESLAGSLSFMVFSVGIWMWALALYAHAWLTTRWLRKRGQAIRPDFAIGVFPMPNSLLFLLSLAAFASLAGSPPMAFAGKSLLIALLMPYFLLGCALMHRTSKEWPSRGFFLFFVYFTVATQFWPALILSASGLYSHIKRLSGGKN